jgi:hypothetical protein
MRWALTSTTSFNRGTNETRARPSLRPQPRTPKRQRPDSGHPPPAPTVEWIHPQMHHPPHTSAPSLKPTLHSTATTTNLLPSACQPEAQRSASEVHRCGRPAASPRTPTTHTPPLCRAMPTLQPSSHSSHPLKATAITSHTSDPTHPRSTSEHVKPRPPPTRHTLMHTLLACLP